MNILLTGTSGLVGSALAEHLFAAGHSFFSLQRNKDTGQPDFWKFERLEKNRTISSIDAVIHLAGENIATGRWTRRKKERILQSRVDGTATLAEYCARLAEKPKVFFVASAIGFYGNRGKQQLDESSRSGSNFVAEVCRAWEDAADPARRAGIRVIQGRIGMVLSGKGGTLTTMLPSFKLGIAGVVGDGSQYISWVGINDLVKMITFLVEHDSISGPVNLVAPEPTTNRIFTKALGAVLERPTVMTMPAFVAKAVFGQMADELILSSCRVLPRVLEKHGYQFVSPDLEQTLRDCVTQP